MRKKKKMNAYLLKPAEKETIWGGDRLARYGKSPLPDLGETWELSFTRGGEATVGGKPLGEVFPKETWGTRAEKFDRFPVLTKFIDAKSNLSVQVHPSDAYALANENSYGKTEMWYIVEAEPGAGLYMGLNRPATAEEFRAAIADGTVEDLLSFRPVKAGDVFFIPSGTLHAIGKGVLLYEIQQNSDLTYRVYDYNRRDAQGNLRQLHVEKAMKVADLSVWQPQKLPAGNSHLIGADSYFYTELNKLNFTKQTFFVGEESFLALTCTRGGGKLTAGETTDFRLGQTYFLPAGSGDVTVEGEMDVIAVSAGREPQSGSDVAPAAQ